MQWWIHRKFLIQSGCIYVAILLFLLTTIKEWLKFVLLQKDIHYATYTTWTNQYYCAVLARECNISLRMKNKKKHEVQGYNVTNLAWSFYCVWLPMVFIRYPWSKLVARRSRVALITFVSDTLKVTRLGKEAHGWNVKNSIFGSNGSTVKSVNWIITTFCQLCTTLVVMNTILNCLDYVLSYCHARLCIA